MGGNALAYPSVPGPRGSCLSVTQMWHIREIPYRLQVKHKELNGLCMRTFSKIRLWATAVACTLTVWCLHFLSTEITGTAHVSYIGTSFASREFILFKEKLSLWTKNLGSLTLNQARIFMQIIVRSRGASFFSLLLLLPESHSHIPCSAHLLPHSSAKDREKSPPVFQEVPQQGTKPTSTDFPWADILQ